MGRPKITVVGAGNVGGTTAQRLAGSDAYDVVLVDIVEGVPQGKALDISQAGPVCGYSTRVVGTNGYEETAGSSVAVITSGIPRKPGMSRDELLTTNAKIVKSVVNELVSRSPEHHSHSGDQSIGCHGPCGPTSQADCRSRESRHGRRAGFRAHAHIHRR